MQTNFMRQAYASRRLRVRLIDPSVALGSA